MLTLFASPASAQVPEARGRFARADIPAPVLNTPDFRSVFGGADGRTLAVDNQGLIRAVEFVALPGTAFRIVDTLRRNGTTVYQVETDEYPDQQSGLYVDSRFVTVSVAPPPIRPKRRPARQQILDRMAANQGLPYVWGGNVARGIPEMLEYYPPLRQLSQTGKELWALYGLDCSGLLYEAANGTTPRNTSDLITFGEPVSIEGLSASQIAAKLQPLDLIVWKGHVIIVYDQNRTIESCLSCSPRGGVTIRNLRDVLNEVMDKRKAANQYPVRSASGEKYFVIRRWA